MHYYAVNFVFNVSFRRGSKRKKNIQKKKGHFERSSLFCFRPFPETPFLERPRCRGAVLSFKKRTMMLGRRENKINKKGGGREAAQGKTRPSPIWANNKCGTMRKAKISHEDAVYWSSPLKQWESSRCIVLIVWYYSMILYKFKKELKNLCTIRFRQRVRKGLVLKCLNICVMLSFYEILRICAESTGHEM